MESLRKIPVVYLLAGLSLCWVTDALPAGGERGFYLGLVATAEEPDVRYQKSVVIKASGAGNHDSGSADDKVYGLGAVIGYRWPLSDDGNVYLSGEVEGTYHTGEIRGKLEGACAHGGACTRYTDVFPQRWKLEKEYGWGATLKLGFRPEFLGTGASLYALAGIRYIETDFQTTFSGCIGVPSAGSDPASCPAQEYLVDNTSRFDRDFDAWMAGVGMEKSLDESFALQVEARYTDYDRDNWDIDTAEDKVTEGTIIPEALSGKEIGLSLRLVRYF